MARTGWRQVTEALALYGERRIIVIGLLGFSSGLPLLLTASTLAIWLRLEDVSLAAIGLFSLVRTPYTFKFLWAPLIDHLPLPLLTGWLGRRRSWALFSQVLLMAAIAALGGSSPGEAPILTAILACTVAFCSASQDIVIDAYRIESLAADEQGLGNGAIVLGYRVGLLAAGAGALWLAAVLTWPQVYGVMAALVAVGIVTILLTGEPEAQASEADSVGRSWIETAVYAPFADFMRRPDWKVIFLFIVLYKMGDAYLGVMANPFYIEIGFSTVEIANVSKIFGLGATLVGALIGGILVKTRGILPSLLLCGVLQMLSNLVFAAQAAIGHNVAFLVVTIAVENVTGGMATTAFVAYLSALCSPAYTATQYALLSSLMAFARDILAASSGWAAEALGWVGFFIFSTVLAVPGLLLLVWLMRRQALPSDPPER
jgi:PAT family beta-lactamase induction signal transducer AmpG